MSSATYLDKESYAYCSYREDFSRHKSRGKLNGVLILELNFRTPARDTGYISDMAVQILENYRGLGEILTIRNPEDIDSLVERTRSDKSFRHKKFTRLILAGHSHYFGQGLASTQYQDITKRHIGGFTPSQIAALLQHFILLRMTNHMDLYCCEVGLDMRVRRLLPAEGKNIFSSEGMPSFAYDFNPEVGELSVDLNELPPPSSHESFRGQSSISTLEWLARNIREGVDTLPFTLRGFCGAGYIGKNQENRMYSLPRIHKTELEEAVESKREIVLKDAEARLVIGINKIHSVVIRSKEEREEAAATSFSEGD